MSSSPIRVVVVGGSYGGISFINNFLKEAKALKKPVQITLVERNDRRYHSLGAFRALVQPDFAKNLWIPYTSVFPKGSPHKIVQGSLKEVHHHHIVLENGNSIPFDYLVLATGSSNPFPAKFNGVNSHTHAMELNQKYHKAVRAARHITVIGAGASGVELAGEIANAFPDKKVTVIHATSRPVDYPGYADSFKAATTKHLEGLGVELIFNERISIPGLDMQNPVLEGHRQIQLSSASSRKQKTFETDLVFLSTGYVVDTSYLQTLKPQNSNDTSFGTTPLVDTHTHRIKTNAHMQMAHPAFPHIFTIGDCSDAYETATAASCKFAGPVIAKNVIKTINGEPASSLLTKPDVMKAMILATGPSTGVSLMPLFGTRFGNFFSRLIKSKDLMYAQTWGDMNLQAPKA